MLPDKVKFAILACSSCGAPMRPDTGKEAFFCPFCDHTIPYSESTMRGMRPLVYKHHDVEVQDGLIKLIRVAVMEGVHSSLSDYDPMDPYLRWARSFNDYVASIDRRAYVTRRDSTVLQFSCVHCGAPVQGRSTQTMYECEHCDSVFGLDDLAELGLDKMPQIIGNQSMVPSKSLPFKLTRRTAEARIRYLVSQFPDFFADYDVDALLRGGALAAVYTPASLCDFALRTSTESSLGNAEFYLEWIDWALPRDTGIDIALLDRIAPWDYNEAGAFIPELVMGDVLICAATNFADKLGVINSIMYRNAKEAIVERYGARRLQLIRWSHDLVEHRSGLIALPVFYLESHDGAGGGLRVLVNGQSGAVQACARGRERTFLRAARRERRARRRRADDALGPRARALREAEPSLSGADPARGIRPQGPQHGRLGRRRSRRSAGVRHAIPVRAATNRRGGEAILLWPLVRRAEVR